VDASRPVTVSSDLQVNISYLFCNPNIHIFISEIWRVPIPAVAWFTGGSSLAGIVGSNPAGGMDICLL
jgi:hypothetical protein